MHQPMIALILAVTSIAGMCREKLPDIPPTGLADRPLPALEASTVDVPISVSLAFITNQLEGAVPRSLSVAPYNEQVNGGADNCDDGGVSFGWGIDRSPITVGAAGNTIGMAFGVQYFVQARAKPDIGPFCGPLVGASCGVGEPRRTANLDVRVPIAIAPNWTFSASHANVAATPTNRCLVTIFQRDVTDTVMAAFRQQLQQQANTLNGRLQQIALRSRLESAWQTLLQPIDVAPQTWLTVNPTALRVSPIAGTADTVNVSVGMSAMPTITVGARPDPVASPLPDATPAGGGSGFHLAVPVMAQTSELTAQLRRALKIDEGGVRYPPVGRYYIQPDDVELWAYGTQVVARIHFKGSATGTLYLTGTPAWNGATNTLSVPDLDYLLETKNLLLKLAKWAEGERFRDDLRNRLQLNLTPQIDQARTLVQESLNRTTGIVRLSGGVNALRVAGLYVHPGDATVRIIAVADGTLRAGIQ